MVGFKEKFANLNHPTSTPSPAKINQSLVFVVRLKRSPCSIPPHPSATTSTKKAFVAKRQFYNCVVKYFESYFSDLSHLILSLVFVSLSGSRLHEVWILSVGVFLFSSYVFTSGLYLNLCLAREFP